MRQATQVTPLSLPETRAVVESPKRSATPTATPVRVTSTPYFTPTIRPAQTQTIPLPTSLPWICSPLAEHTWKDLQEIVSNPFVQPTPGKDNGHQGVDFAYYRRGERLSILGVTVQAVLPGKVAAVILNRPPYGFMLIVETPSSLLPVDVISKLEIPGRQSLYVLYAHMQAEPLVELGQNIACDQPLGQVGNTPEGWSSAPHLHLETRIGPAGVVFDGMANYDNSVSVKEKTNYERWRISGDFRVFDPLRLLTYLD